MDTLEIQNPCLGKEELKSCWHLYGGLLPSLETLRDLQRDVAKSKLVTPDFNEQSLQALSDLLNETQAYYESGVDVDVLKDKLRELAQAFEDQTEEGQKAVDNAARTKALLQALVQLLMDLQKLHVNLCQKNLILMA